MFNCIGCFCYVEGIVIGDIVWCFVGVDVVYFQMCCWEVVGFGDNVEEIGGLFVWIGIGVEVVMVGEYMYFKICYCVVFFGSDFCCYVIVVGKGGCGKVFYLVFNLFYWDVGDDGGNDCVDVVWICFNFVVEIVVDIWCDYMDFVFWNG